MNEGGKTKKDIYRKGIVNTYFRVKLSMAFI